MNFKSIIRKLRVQETNIYCTVHTSSPSERLNKSVIVLTGGGSGIGRAIAEKAAAEGAKVIILGRRESKLQEVVKKVGRDQCRYFVYDVTKYEGKGEIFEYLESVFKTKITALVNNAGVFVNKSPGDFTGKDYDVMMNTNLKAPFLLTQEFIKYCDRNDISGNIVMIASNRALFGDYSPYGISKRGLVHLTEGMARESIGKGTRVNAVAPGMTASEINGIAENGNLYTPYVKGKRVILPEEIAEVVCFLLSKYSSCINGSVIPCDEGDFLR